MSSPWPRGDGGISRGSGSPIQDEQGRLCALRKGENVGNPSPEDRLDVGCPAVPEADANHFRRLPSKEAVLTVVAILRHNRIPHCRCMLPDGLVVGSPEVSNVRRTWIEVCKGGNQPRGEILIEEKFQRSCSARGRLRCRIGNQPTLTISGERERRADILALEI